MKLKFYRTEENEWFVDLPEWQGEISDLQMVCGADTMLDILAQGENEIWLTLEVPGKHGIDCTGRSVVVKAILTLEGICCEDIKYISDSICASGAYYQCNIPYISAPVLIWLCDVTKFVFGKFPEFIYIY